MKQGLDKRLRPHLRAFPRDKVDLFLRALRPILLGNAIAPRSALGAPERVAKLKRILASARSFKELMRPPPLDPQEMLADPLTGDLMRRMFDAARSARGDPELTRKVTQEVIASSGDSPQLLAAWKAMMPHLNSFIAALEQEVAAKTPKRTGRPSADPDGMLAEVARAYADILEEQPTSTESGTFYNIAVEILGISDPQRWVLAAIRNYKPTKLPRPS